MQLKSIFCLITCYAESCSNPEAVVFRKILANYTKDVRPVHNVHEAVDLNIRFVFRSLNGIVSTTTMTRYKFKHM